MLPAPRVYLILTQTLTLLPRRPLVQKAETLTFKPIALIATDNMRALLMVALAFPLALVGGLAAPLAGAPPTTPLEAASVDAAAPSVASACALATPSARVGAGYVALRWAPCPGATSYTLLRGDSPDALAPLVEVAHAGHVDVAVVAGGVYYYAVGSDGARSPLVVAALPSA